MKKEYLLMTMVTADKEIDNEIIRAYPIGIKADENIWIHPSRLIDPKNLEYGYLKAGDIYFSSTRGEWLETVLDDYSEDRYLIHRKPKPDKWQAWEDNCPLTEWSPEMREKLIDWIREGIMIEKGE